MLSGRAFVSSLRVVGEGLSRVVVKEPMLKDALLVK